MGGATRGQAHKFDPTTTAELTRYGRVDQGGTGGGGGGRQRPEGRRSRTDRAELTGRGV